MNNDVTGILFLDVGNLYMHYFPEGFLSSENRCTSSWFWFDI